MKLGHTITRIQCPDMSTLVWVGDEIVDITTNQRIRPDGTYTSRQFSMGYAFDRALCVKDDDALWAIAYENRGTKGVLLRNGKIHRELNRSYYFAKAFDYPIVFMKRSKGGVVVVHCPTSYDTLEFEDAENGETLQSRQTSKMEFHSRLAASADGKFLASAGWFWHPVNGAWLTSIGDSFKTSVEPAKEVSFSFGADIDSAVFLGNDSLVVSTRAEVINEKIPTTALGPMRLGVWSIADDRWSSDVELAEISGTLMPWRDWVISFYGHPKAIELATGAVVCRWEQIYSGRQVGAIDLGEPAPPPIALDPLRGRFAVGSPKGVTVVTLEALVE